MWDNDEMELWWTDIHRIHQLSNLIINAENLWYCCCSSCDAAVKTWISGRLTIKLYVLAPFSVNEFKLRGGEALVYLQWSSISQKSERSKGQRGPQPQQSPTHPPVWSWFAVNVNCRSAAPSFYLFSSLLPFLQFTLVLSPRSSSLCFLYTTTHNFPAAVEKLLSLLWGKR